MSKIGEEINDLLAELTKELKKESKQPGDVSANDLALATGLGRRRCTDILNEKVEKGELIKVKVSGDSCKFVYRKKVT